MNKVKIGIIGTGFTIGIAKAHLEGYLANNRSEVVALYDIVPGRAAEWAEKKEVKNVAICESLNELFNMVDAVSICTSNNSHADLVIKALEAGKHVLCEKPLAMSYEEALKAADVSKKYSEKVAMVVFNRRDEPFFQLIKKYVDEGKIGKVYSCFQQLGGNRIADPKKVELEWRMQRQLSGSGALADFAVHMVDRVDYLLSTSVGSICEVQAMANTFINERKVINSDEMGNVTNDDYVVIHAKTEKGALLSFIAGRLGTGGTVIELIGEGGIISFNGGKELDLWLKAKDGSYDPNAKEKVLIPEEYKEISEHKGVINEFINAILDGAAYSRNMERGLYIQNILGVLEKSINEGKTIKL